MKSIVKPCLVVLITILGAACAEDPAPMEAVIQYTACVGREGTCGVNDCCANSVERRYGDEHNIRCTVRRGSLSDRYSLTFEVSTPQSSDPGISGESLQFLSTATTPRPVYSCESFGVREDGNTFEAQTCESVDAPPNVGGGCVIELYLDSENTVIGRFQCKEIQLPAQDRYFSTVRGGGVDWGSIEIQNCSIRL